MPDNKRILIVEDDILDGWPLEVTLQKAGYEVIGIAETPEEAIDRALHEQPDIILMDIWLQDDRRAGIKAAHEIENQIKTHVIYLTGVEISEDLLNEVRQTRSYNFLTKKPIDEQLLLATVSLAPLRRRDSNLVFVCYSHKDANMAQEMQQFLETLAEVGVDTWVDTTLELGSKWKDEIEEALNQAKAAVLLVSIDFVKSKFITDIELPALLEAAASRGLIILPVFVGPIPKGTLKRMGLKKYQAINKPKEPLNRWEKSKRALEAWVPLAEFLEEKLGLASDGEP